MSKRNEQPEFLSLPAACRRIGISVTTAAKLASDEQADFPPVFLLGSRRMVSRRRLENWLAEKNGPSPTTSA
jgi:predicted DNA-binding transcriptional regulator AlpA